MKEAERVVDAELTAFFENQARPITDPAKVVTGLSLPSRIIAALRGANLLPPELPAEDTDRWSRVRPVCPGRVGRGERR